MASSKRSFHQFQASSLQGEAIDFTRYAAQVVLVVNTASQCRFTPQYAELEQLYQQYRDQGLVILGFPCNQFGGQEPGDVRAIEQTCLINYGVSFPMFEKIDVNGPNSHPLYQYLRREQPGLLGQRIWWNFTKFLIGRDGKPLRRFAPCTAPTKLAPAIRQAL